MCLRDESFAGGLDQSDSRPWSIEAWDLSLFPFRISIFRPWALPFSGDGFNYILKVFVFLPTAKVDGPGEDRIGFQAVGVEMEESQLSKNPDESKVHL